MKCSLRIFELSKNEQRVVLFMILILITIAFVEYERRVHHFPAQLTSGTDLKPSPSPVEIEHER
jgi:hypothetical protein